MDGTDKNVKMTILIYIHFVRFIHRCDVSDWNMQGHAWLKGLIDRLGDYCKRWRMKENTDETKIIKFRRNGHCCKTTFFYGETLIEKSYKLQISRTGIQCIWYLVKRYGQFIYQIFKGTFFL